VKASTGPRGVILGVAIGLLAVPAAAHAQVGGGGFEAAPAPSGAADGAKTGKSGDIVVYHYKGQDQDTFVMVQNGVYSFKQYGDPDIAIFRIAVASTVDGKVVPKFPSRTAYNPDAGTAEWDIAVQLKPVLVQTVVIDKWAIGDTEPQFSARHDQMPTVLNQTITINP